jgi:hypothetical protein
MNIHSESGKQYVLSVGDRVEYMPFGGPTRDVDITAVLADVKNGRPGFDAVVRGGWNDAPGDTVWGYAYQILTINGVRLE